MTVEIDPDLRLYTRLSLGSGWALALNGAIWIAAASLMLSNQTGVLLPFFLGDRTSAGDVGYLFFALAALVFAPARAVARLLDLERGGLLDQTRLCARPPSRTLAAFLIGSTGLFVMLAATLLARQLLIDQDLRVLALALLVFTGAVGVALLAYGSMPSSMTTDSRFLTPLLFLAAVAATAGLRIPVWIQELAFGEPAALLTIAATIAVFAAGLVLATRRLRRPAVSLLRLPWRLAGMWRERGVPGARFPRAPQPIEVVALGAIFLALTIAHVKRRVSVRAASPGSARP